MPELEHEKIKSFYEYLEKRIQKKQEERSAPGIDGHSKNLLKTEIAEIKVIFNAFENMFLENRPKLRDLIPEERKPIEKKKSVDISEKIFKLINDAERGDAPSQYILGLIYLLGDKGIKKDYTEAVKWFEKAAKKNYAKAQYYLGLIYAKGMSVKKDSIESVKWFKKAADQGHVEAKVALNKMSS